MPELRVRVKPAGSKGLGVFAKQYGGPGRYVGRYVGECLNMKELISRYRNEQPKYVYRLNTSHAIDARDSVHFSRYINHNARPNLHAEVSAETRSIAFYAIRPLHVGIELTIDCEHGIRPLLTQLDAAGLTLCVCVRVCLADGISYWMKRAEVPEVSTEPRLRRRPSQRARRQQRLWAQTHAAFRRMARWMRRA